ncbi:transcriptional regulator [Sesbania bispinosa]|nr:transcriptional regulator [Sesbania bispinosa]
MKQRRWSAIVGRMRSCDCARRIERGFGERSCDDIWSGGKTGDDSRDGSGSWLRRGMVERSPTIARMEVVAMLCNRNTTRRCGYWEDATSVRLVSAGRETRGGFLGRRSCAPCCYCLVTIPPS